VGWVCRLGRIVTEAQDPFMVKTGRQRRRLMTMSPEQRSTLDLVCRVLEFVCKAGGGDGACAVDVTRQEPLVRKRQPDKYQ
jgi:hypothetical protein